MQQSVFDLGTVLEIEETYSARPERIVARVRVLQGDPRIGMHFDDPGCGEVWKLVGFGSHPPGGSPEGATALLLCFANTIGHCKLETGVRLIERR